MHAHVQFRVQAIDLGIGDGLGRGNQTVALDKGDGHARSPPPAKELPDPGLGLLLLLKWFSQDRSSSSPVAQLSSSNSAGARCVEDEV